MMRCGDRDARNVDSRAANAFSLPIDPKSFMRNIDCARETRAISKEREGPDEEASEKTRKFVQNCPAKIIVNDRSEKYPLGDQVVASNNAWLEYSMKRCFQTYNKNVKTYAACVCVSFGTRSFFFVSNDDPLSIIHVSFRFTSR